MVETYMGAAFQSHPYAEAGIHHAGHTAAGILPYGKRVLEGGEREKESEQMGK